MASLIIFGSHMEREAKSGSYWCRSRSKHEHVKITKQFFAANEGNSLKSLGKEQTGIVHDSDLWTDEQQRVIKRFSYVFFVLFFFLLSLRVIIERA